MDTILFHKDVFIPDFAKIPLHQGSLKYSNHARNVTAGSNRVKEINLPATFDAKNATLIEVEVNAKSGKVEKQLWRQHFDETNDICFPMIRDGFIKTVWLNAKKDTHVTLNKSKFMSGFQWRSMKNKVLKDL